METVEEPDLTRINSRVIRSNPKYSQLKQILMEKQLTNRMLPVNAISQPAAKLGSPHLNRSNHKIISSAQFAALF